MCSCSEKEWGVEGWLNSLGNDRGWGSNPLAWQKNRVQYESLDGEVGELFLGGGGSELGGDCAEGVKSRVGGVGGQLLLKTSGGQETGYWGAGWKMLGKRLNGGKQPLSWPDTVSPMSFAPEPGQEEGGAAWIEVRPRNPVEEDKGDLGRDGRGYF